MDITCTENECGCILEPRFAFLSPKATICLEDFIKKNAIKNKVAINFENISQVCPEFLDFLKENAKEQKLSLFNMNSEIFALLNLTKHDKFANIFLNDLDFISQKRRLINRRFEII